MNIETNISEKVKNWADDFLCQLSLRDTSLDLNVDCVVLSSTIAAKEDKLQEAFDNGTDPGKGNEPFLMKVLMSRLDGLGVKRTRAADVIATLGINSPGEAVMVAALMKRMLEVQPVKPEKVTAGLMMTLLEGYTIKESLFIRMWEKQKGYVCGVSCDNLLDIATPADFEN